MLIESYAMSMRRTVDASKIATLQRYWPFSANYVDTTAATITELVTGMTSEVDVGGISASGNGYDMSSSGIIADANGVIPAIPSVGTATDWMLVAAIGYNGATSRCLFNDSAAGNDAIHIAHNTSNASLDVTDTAGNNDTPTDAGGSGATKTWVYVATFDRDAALAMTVWDTTNASAPVVLTPDTTIASGAMIALDTIRPVGVQYGTAVFFLSEGIQQHHKNTGLAMGMNWIAGNKGIPRVCESWT